jgi:hypothetical protein
MDVLADGINIQDLSLRTRVRGLSPQGASGPYYIGITARDTFTRDSVTGTFVSAYIGSDGILGMGYAIDNVTNGPGNAVNYPWVSPGINFLNEDVNLQLDIVGNQARLTAWNVSNEKPQLPQITATLPGSLSKSGTVALWVFPESSDWDKPAVFRHVELVAIPEPSSVVLGSLSAIALGSFAFRIRLRRCRC